MSTNPSATAHSQITPMPSDSILKFEPNIVVRPFRASDASSMAHHANNRKIWLRMTNAFPHPYTVEAAEDYIASNIDSTCFVASGPFDVQTSNGAGPKMPTKFALCIDDYCVGSIGITFLSDVTCRLARLGYWIGEDCWAKGILSKVAPAFVRWSMETFGRLMRIEGGGRSRATILSVLSQRRPAHDIWQFMKAIQQVVGSSRNAI